MIDWLPCDASFFRGFSFGSPCLPVPMAEGTLNRKAFSYLDVCLTSLSRTNYTALELGSSSFRTMYYSRSSIYRCGILLCDRLLAKTMGVVRKQFRSGWLFLAMASASPMVVIREMSACA
jgi:hypothetical protein